MRYQTRDVLAGRNTGPRLIGDLHQRAILALQPIDPGLSPNLDELLPEDQTLTPVGIWGQVPNPQLMEGLAGIAEEPTGRIVCGYVSALVIRHQRGVRRCQRQCDRAFSDLTWHAGISMRLKLRTVPGYFGGTGRP